MLWIPQEALTQALTLLISIPLSLSAAASLLRRPSFHRATMSSSASQQSRVMGRRRKNKRARDSAVADAVAKTTRVRQECEDALATLARLEQENREAIRMAIAEEIEKLTAEDFGVVAEDGVDDGGPCEVLEDVFKFVVVRDADRERCARCHKFVTPGGSVLPAASSYNGSVCNTASVISVSGGDQELEDDGASS